MACGSDEEVEGAWLEGVDDDFRLRNLGGMVAATKWRVNLLHILCIIILDCVVFRNMRFS